MMTATKNKAQRPGFAYQLAKDHDEALLMNEVFDLAQADARKDTFGFTVGKRWTPAQRRRALHCTKGEHRAKANGRGVLRCEDCGERC